MQNTLKRQTKPVIHELIQANIRCVMVTGDNLLTAISVARDCQMIPPNHKVLIVEAVFDDDANNHASVKFVSTEEHEEDLNDYRSEIPNVDIISSSECRPYHFAMSGKSWAVLKTYFPRMCTKMHHTRL